MQNSKEIAKKLQILKKKKTIMASFQAKIKKLKNTITYSFEAKIGWTRMRKGENKNYSSVPFLSDASQKIPKKNSKKIQKIEKNTIMASFQAKIGLKRLRKIENKNYTSVPFLPEA